MNLLSIVLLGAFLLACIVAGIAAMFAKKIHAENSMLRERFAHVGRAVDTTICRFWGESRFTVADVSGDIIHLKNTEGSICLNLKQVRIWDGSPDEIQNGVTVWIEPEVNIGDRIYAYSIAGPDMHDFPWMWMVKLRIHCPM